MKKKRLMIFLEGTAFNTRLYALFFTPNTYTPIGNAVSKINDWHRSYDVILCTFRKRNIGLVRRALRYYGVEYDSLEYRRKGETYSDVIIRISPDILIEDDCKSIGGEKEMCITNVPDELRTSIKAVVVEEFKGIDTVSL